MCGIAGVLDREGGSLGDVTPLAADLGRALAHRGPDGSGTWRSADGALLLVHRRLAIIDPTPRADQPMSTPDGRHHVVFNGEIYNYRELRSVLESCGERFTTTSDTEVLLRLIVRDGPASLARVRGMFALGWWDDADRSLLVARDRFGMKPLYVASGTHRIGFASELSALRAAGLTTTDVSPAGVLAFLTWGSVPPPLTWQRDVEMLVPGTWRRWRLGGSDEHGVFASVRDLFGSHARTPLAESELRAAARDAVRDSVQAHLVADVPVGVFLSGGIDSGALVSTATSLGADNLQTFTVGFDEPSSEIALARSVADKFGTEHHELHLTSSQVSDDLPAVLARLDQPTIDAVNSFYVAKAVAATGIKAVLSGAGGDELFGGYPSFTRIPRALRAKRLAGPAWSTVAAAADPFMPDRLRNRWRHFAATNGSITEAYRVQRGFFLPGEIAAMLGPALRERSAWREATGELESVEHALLEPSHEETPAASIARMETQLYLGSQLLRDIDAMSMAHGLEVRAPFVDATLAASLWPDVGNHPRLLAGKRLLWETLDRRLPDAIVRRRKQGFTLPFARWVGGELAPMVDAGMRRLARAGWIDDAVPDRVWSDWRKGAAHWSRPWGLAVLGHFLGGITA